MVGISVEFEGQIRRVIAEHERTFTLMHGNVTELVEVLCDYYGEGITTLMKDPSTDQYFDKHAWILVNGTIIKELQGLNTMLKEGDKVIVASPVGGM
ncbi:MAG: MoaD/ThiS family protein [Promethearchaeota archaeon]